jgi:hypothetical protein
VDRTENLIAANTAARRATALARDAESSARHSGTDQRTAALAAAGALWAQVARTHAAIAAALPATSTED